jgi:hypothetical protein
MGGDLPQTIHDLEKLDNRECHTCLGVPGCRRPPADPHELLPFLDRAVTEAVTYSNSVHTRYVNQTEILVGGERIWTVVAWWMAQLDYQPKILEGLSLKKTAIPLLCV